MAQNVSTITMPLPRLTVKITLTYGLRMWITTALLGIVGKVCPHHIEVEIDGAAPKS